VNDIQKIFSIFSNHFYIVLVIFYLFDIFLTLLTFKNNNFRYILDQIKHEKLENKINLIILSDHGMDIVTYNRMIHLDEYVSNSTYKSIMSGPNAFIHPNPSK